MLGGNSQEKAKFLSQFFLAILQYQFNDNSRQVIHVTLKISGLLFTHQKHLNLE